MPRIISPSTKADAGRVADLELDAPGVAHDLDVEVAVAVEDLLGVVGVGAAVEHGERALAEQRVQAAVARIEELADLGLREILEAAARADARVDELGDDDAGFHCHGAKPSALRAGFRWARCPTVSSQISTHVGVGHGDAAVGPVPALVVGRAGAAAGSAAVDHDRAARHPSRCGGPVCRSASFGIGDLDREEEVAARVAPREAVAALRACGSLPRAPCGRRG